jgi:hypothetical protein
MLLYDFYIIITFVTDVIEFYTLPVDISASIGFAPVCKISHRLFFLAQIRSFGKWRTEHIFQRLIR